MTAVLGLAAAAGYGAADFLGGWASRRGGVLPVVLWSQVAGLVALGLALALLRGAAPSRAALGWGATAGVVVAVGLVVYFRGLARARMGVVAPITAVVTATVPVCAGLLAGERPSAVALSGVALAVAAVALVTLAPSRAGPPGPLAPASPPVLASRTAPAGVIEAVIAGGAFGLFFVCMDRTGAGAAVWPLLAANAASLVVLVLAVAVSKRAWRAPRASLPLIVGAGVCGTAASLAFLLAVRDGLLSLVSVLASLSPAMTVALARIVMSERLGPGQLAGLAAAVAGVGLIAAG